MTTKWPTGTVTFFFSDVEGSTGLLQRLGAEYRAVIERHAFIIRRSLTAHDGVEVSTEGDSFFAVFNSASKAVSAASDVQSFLAEEQWPEGGTVVVRVGLHTGVGELGHDNYVGIDVNRAARIGSVGHGGQVVVSESVRSLVPDADYSDLGEHSLKGLDRHEHLYQLNVAGLPQRFPPLRTDSNRPNNLPTLATELLGRQEELAELREMVESNRLLTIAGPGGVGKTRLAVELANEVLPSFEQGAFLIDLAPIGDPRLVLPEIASTLGVDEGADGGLIATLASGSRLLVLDNFEQVLDAGPDLANLLERARPTKAVVTSQRPLRIQGEHVFRLDPLSASGASSPAIELFAARAKQVDPTFDLDAHLDHVTKLVEALEGVPLAIELAAARSNVLSPGELLERLETGIEVLKMSRADTPDRHRSLEAAVAWSYDLLSDEQRLLLHTLAVFRGGATLQAVEAVSGRDPLDDLSELVDRSLVRTAGGTAGKRFALLAPVQKYAEGRVEDIAELRQRHTGFFTALAGSAREPLEGDARARWLAVLSDEQDNVRATLDHLLTIGDVQGGYLLLGNVWRYFQSAGQLHELALWLERFFDADDEFSPTFERARALLARAALYYWRGEWSESVADYEAARAISESLDDKELLGESLMGLTGALGNAAGAGQQLGDPGETAARAHRIFTELGDKAAVAGIEFGMEIMRTMRGSPPELPDREALHRIQRLYEESGRLMSLAQGYITLAQMDSTEGHYADARGHALTAIETAENAGDIFTIGWALRWLGVALVELGEPALGAKFAGAANAAESQLGGKFPEFPWFTDRAEDRARTLIGPEADRAFQEGREMSILEAAKLARQATRPTT